MSSFKDNYSLILKEIDGALAKTDQKQVATFVDTLLGAQQVFVIGVGRVMLSMAAMAKRLNHIGIKAYCVGDINEPPITDKDVLIVGSASGESIIPVSIAKVASKYRPKIIHIGSNPNSSLAPLTDIFVRIPVKSKLNLTDEIDSKQIMTSLFEQSLYILCDTVCLMILEKRGFDEANLRRHHANLE